MKDLFGRLGIFIIIFVWVIFAFPYLFASKTPFPSRYQVNNFAPWSAYPEFAGPVKNDAMPDVVGQIYTWRFRAVKIWESGQIPLWNPTAFSSSPLLANYQSAVLSPLNILFIVFDFLAGKRGFEFAWMLLIILQPLLAGLFMFLYMRSIKTSDASSVVASVSFMFCGFVTAWMGYGTLGYAILFLPASLFAVEKFYETSRVRFLILLSVAVPLSFFSGHFQISVYFFIFLLSYTLYKYVVTRNLSHTAKITLFLFFGVLLAAPQLLPSIETYTQSVRSTSFGTGEIIPWSYLPTILAPDFFGNPVTRNQWFGHYAEWNAYLGLLPFFFALYALLYKRSSRILFFLLASLFVLFLAFPTPLLDFAIRLHIPALSTSAASRIIVLFSFSAAVLSGIGFDAFAADAIARKRKKLLVWSLLLPTALFVLYILTFFNGYIPASYAGITRSNLKFPLIIGGFALLIIWLALLMTRKSAILFASMFLIALVVFDMIRFTTKWMPQDPAKLVYPDIPVTNYFRKIAGYNRGFGNYGGEVATYYSIPMVEGYDALYPRRYGEFMTALDTGAVREPPRSGVSFPKNGRYTSAALNLLGIKYLIQKVSDGRFVWAFPYWTYPESQFKLLYNDGRYMIFENTKAYPRAFFVKDYTVESENQKIINTMFSSGFDLRNSTVLETNPHVNVRSGDANGEAKITLYSPNKIMINTNNRFDSLLVLTDNYYPGWKAFVDSKKMPIFRADYTFRAVAVPRGKHTLTFLYDPVPFKTGAAVSLVGLLGILGTSFMTKKK